MDRIVPAGGGTRASAHWRSAREVDHLVLVAQRLDAAGQDQVDQVQDSFIGDAEGCGADHATLAALGDGE